MLKDNEFDKILNEVDDNTMNIESGLDYVQCCWVTHKLKPSSSTTAGSCRGEQWGTADRVGLVPGANSHNYEAVCQETTDIPKPLVASMNNQTITSAVCQHQSCFNLRLQYHNHYPLLSVLVW